MSKSWTRLSKEAILPAVVDTFSPRTTFEVPESIPRSYYLGHHAAGLSRMTTQLTNIGLVLECRDSRAPLTSWNPLLERSLVGPRRIVVYTKSDLAIDSPKSVQDILHRFHAKRPGERAVFWTKGSSTAPLLRVVKDIAKDHEAITGMRTFVVGMPNVGKSTLLNALRNEGMGRRPKAAMTGNHPGVTRKLSTPVRILGGKDQPDIGMGEGVFVVDTPGVFMPHVSSGESMLKLALVHGVKDNLVPQEIVADYLLYRLNLWDHTLYAKYSPPTNDIDGFLASVASKTGKIARSRLGNNHQAAQWIIEQWRSGHLGRYVLDDVTQASLEAKMVEMQTTNLSMNQARRKAKEVRKEKAEAKRHAG